LPREGGPRLVVDEDLPARFASDLKKRGYDATSVKELGLAGAGVKDPDLIAHLAERCPGCVLITFDNKMVEVHRAALVRHRMTLAIVDSRADREGLDELEYIYDVMHRWVHRIAAQEPGTVRRYSTTGTRRLEIQ
jgi:hypothetical protein